MTAKKTPKNSLPPPAPNPCPKPTGFVWNRPAFRPLPKWNGPCAAPLTPGWRPCPATKPKIAAIGEGKEVFDRPDTPELAAFLAAHTPRLFKFYERVLNGYCRDKNLAIAKTDPDRFIVPGSVAFLRHLRDAGVKNYFVTGAVVERGMGMWEEVETLGFQTGPGRIVEDIIGSTWTDKLPKDVIMQNLLKTLGADGRNVLVVGDGRAEISAGVGMGALCLSRLGPDEDYKRALHKKLGTHMIVADFTDPALWDMMA